MSLMPTAMPRSGPEPAARGFSARQTKAPMVFSWASIAAHGFGDGGLGRKLAGTDAALEIGERDHGWHPPTKTDRFYEPAWRASKSRAAMTRASPFPRPQVDPCCPRMDSKTPTTTI